MPSQPASKTSSASSSSTRPLAFDLGVKTDPILYRYSFDWLFKLMASEGVKRAQLGTFFELYSLPDDYFRDLRRRADDHGIAITSIFTAHRELGGFFRTDGPGWVEVARQKFERLIDIAGLVGAKNIGSNPGAVLRDQMPTKAAGVAMYLKHFKELMKRAKDRNVEWLTIEPMSCVAEPPTLPEEMRQFSDELTMYHAAHAATTARPGYCVDIAHGYANAQKQIIDDHFALMEAAIPLTCEVHLKNTDASYDSTFGFTTADRARGVIDVAAVRKFYADRASSLPVQTLVGYLEIGGPKLGRDYSDPRLEGMLRESLQHLKATWLGSADATATKGESSIKIESTPQRSTTSAASSNGHAKSPVLIAPSIMCADLLNLESHLQKLQDAGVADLLHLDMMDGHFAPNLALGLALLEQMRPRTKVPFDVHLMVTDNDLFVRELIKIGVERIAVHAESATHLDRTLSMIRDAGIKAGLALNPATPLAAIDYVHHSVDFVLLMTVNPGFAGQKLAGGALRKIADCRAHLDRIEAETGRRVEIEVDGNVSFENIPKMVAAGANELVAGSSSVFSKSGTAMENAKRVHAAIAEGLAARVTKRTK